MRIHRRDAEFAQKNSDFEIGMCLLRVPASAMEPSFSLTPKLYDAVIAFDMNNG